MSLKPSLAALLAIGLTACFPSNVEVTGLVLDKATGKPIAGAEVIASSRGWGLSGGPSVIWDKDYSDRALTDAAGRVAFQHYGDDHPVLCVRAAGYESVRVDDPAAGQTIGMTERMPEIATVVDNQLFVGRTADGSSLGWNFADAEEAEPDASDLILSSPADLDGPITFEAPGGISLEDDASPSGEAPEGGYQTTLEVSPLSRGTIYVRSRDRSHYARVDMGRGISLLSRPDGRRGLLISYLYDPAGGRILRKDLGDPCFLGE